MAIDRRFVAEQLRRFAHYPQFPKTQEELDELLRAFEETCDNERQVRELADYLVRTLKFAPKAADIHEAAERVAEQQRFTGTSPSPYDEPGYADGSLTDGMTLADLRRWQALAERTKHKATRTVALGLIADFYRRHPHLAPDPPKGNPLS